MTRAELNEIHRLIGHVEYRTILPRAAREGWIVPLLEAHFTPATLPTSTALIMRAIREAGVENFRGTRYQIGKRQRGHAYHRNGRYWIRMPSTPGVKSCTLRAGLALHEAAHVIDYWRRRDTRREVVRRKKIGGLRHKILVLKNGRLREKTVSLGGHWIKVRKVVGASFGHGPEFCRVLRALVLDWKAQGGIMPVCSNYAAVYARHQGPYRVLVCRTAPTKKDPSNVKFTLIPGHPMSAEDAHEAARSFVEDPRDPILKAFVLSDTENQFIGAYYERGQTIPAWFEIAPTRSAAESF